MRFLKYQIAAFFIISMATSEPGDLVDYNYQNSFSISTLQIILNSMGEDYSNVLYPISV